ncbi:NAD(P)/FAD-dependent oxidoreductase [Pseudocolwellia sp. AS88]|uniref:NAD(P)/FAD-dependent oxidoreductase n=1 Tax=Pseudocolwellia sp. AS88 TaxID=3063958 RepID=UPI0026EA7249|nr:NAD(P)/FAD-dependent oxidoreductase [Pseudocolwellia sp. AS88]MDO7085246.1 NAD(P)/FAD-dependent oxidoreductase [Pseudocolwellia sp. AS88]
MLKFDVVVIGAGAAGLMAASKSGERGRKTVVLDHAKQPGKKILISGGGRSNFTNYYIEPEKFLCKNPHFCKSALNQYTQWDFISLVEKYKIPYHEKTLGQLFCDDSAKEIVAMLVSECEQSAVNFSFQTEILSIEKLESGQFLIKTNKSDYQCESLIIATGGLSMPKLGATPFAYKIAEQFNLEVLPTRAGLVPFTLDPALKEVLAEVSGISTNVTVTTNNTSFAEDMLITHRGLSGPAILQISSYWHSGDIVEIDLLPSENITDIINKALSEQPNVSTKNLLSNHFAKRFVEKLIDLFEIPNVPIKQLSHKQIQLLSENIHSWNLKPSGTEGYRTAEVTIGGLNTNHLSSKTMEVKTVPGLFFIGEATDVTGWLGGYNFQWAWSSGWVAGTNA